MTSLAPFDADRKGGNDLGGTHRPTGQREWGGLASFHRGIRGTEATDFHHGPHAMGERMSGIGDNSGTGGSRGNAGDSSTSKEVRGGEWRSNDPGGSVGRPPLRFPGTSASM